MQYFVFSLVTIIFANVNNVYTITTGMSDVSGPKSPSRTLANPLSEDAAIGLLRGLNAAATEPLVGPQSTLVPQLDETGNDSLTFKCENGSSASHQTTPTKVRLFWGINPNNPAAPPEVSVYIAASIDEFKSGDTLQGGTTDAAKEVEAMYKVFGPNGSVASLLANGALKTMTAQLPKGKGDTFRQLVRAKPAKILSVLTDDGRTGMEPKKRTSMMWGQKVKFRYKTDPVTFDILEQYAQFFVTAKLFVKRDTAADDEELAKDVAKFHPQSSLALWQKENPEWKPNNRLRISMVDGAPCTWWELLYGKYDSKTLVASVAFAPWRVSLSTQHSSDRIVLTMFLNEIHVIAVIGSNEDAADKVSLTTNDAQKRLMESVYGVPAGGGAVRLLNGKPKITHPTPAR